jgi:hypothetical protein
MQNAKPFDGDISKLATHRKTTPFPPPFHRGGLVSPAKTITVPIGGDSPEAILPKDLVQRLMGRVIKSALVDLLDGRFPFMLEEQPQRLVVIESPFGHPTKIGMEENAAYARKCMLDSLKRGEAPYASHLLYTQCLDDLLLKERKQGMEAGFAWGAAAQHVAVYTDRGISGGMLEGIKRHQATGKTIEFRSIA